MMMTGLGQGAGSSADRCSPFLHRSSFRAVSIAAVGIDQLQPLYWKCFLELC